MVVEAPPGVLNLLCHGQSITSFINLVRELPPKVNSSFQRMSEWESIAVGKMKEVRSRQGKVLALAHKALSENRVTNIENDIDSNVLLEAIKKMKEEVDDILTKKSLLTVEIYDGIDNVLKKVEGYVAKMDEDVLSVYGMPPPPLPLSRGSGLSKSGKGGSSNKNKKLNSDGLKKSSVSGAVEFIDPSEPVYCYCRQVSHGEMLACDNDECEYEWFHYPCVRLSKAPEGEWLCPTCRGLDIPEPLPVKAMTTKVASSVPKQNVEIEQMGIQKKRRRRGLSNEMAGRTRKVSASVLMTSSTGTPLLPLLKPIFVNPPPPPSSLVSSTIPAPSPPNPPEHQEAAGSPPVQSETKWPVSTDENKQKEGRGPGCPRNNPLPPEKPLPVVVTGTSFPPKTIRRAEI
eukprot:431074_1